MLLRDADKVSQHFATAQFAAGPDSSQEQTFGWVA